MWWEGAIERERKFVGFVSCGLGETRSIEILFLEKVRVFSTTGKKVGPVILKIRGCGFLLLEANCAAVMPAPILGET